MCKTTICQTFLAIVVFPASSANRQFARFQFRQLAIYRFTVFTFEICVFHKKYFKVYTFSFNYKTFFLKTTRRVTIIENYKFVTHAQIRNIFLNTLDEFSNKIIFSGLRAPYRKWPNWIHAKNVWRIWKIFYNCQFFQVFIFQLFIDFQEKDMIPATIFTAPKKKFLQADSKFYEKRRVWILVISQHLVDNNLRR